MIKNALYHVFLIVILFVTIINSQREQTFSCDNKDKCHKCIQTPGCAWCMDSGKTRLEDRCFLHSAPNNKCKEIYFPPGNDTSYVVTQNEELTAKTPGKKTKNIIQLYPQEATLKMRISKFTIFNSRM